MLPFSARSRPTIPLYALLVVALAHSHCSPAHATSVDHSTETPDLMQSDPEAGLPDGGEQYCGPVAAMNSMVWLSRRGYSKLAMPQSDRLDVQGKLALQLSQDMKTTKTGGTKVSGFLAGIETYVLRKGYSIASLKYQGWEEHQRRFDGGAEIPSLSFIKNSMDTANTAVWLKIGWYKYFPNKDEYIRFAGHWVTVVGMDNDSLSIHDPAPRSGKIPRSERVFLMRLAHGKVSTAWKGDRIYDAKNFYNLGGELKIKKRADYGLLDGVAALTLKSP